jgi:hypothetical protein
MLTLRRVVIGLIMLAIGASVALSGCSFAMHLASGKWQYHKDGTRTCVEGDGHECVVGGATGSANT